MAICQRCGNEVGGLSSLLTFNRQKGRCKNCEVATQQTLIRFREAFLRLSGVGMFSSEKLRPVKLLATSQPFKPPVLVCQYGRQSGSCG